MYASLLLFAHALLGIRGYHLLFLVFDRIVRKFLGNKLNSGI